MSQPPISIDRRGAQRWMAALLLLSLALYVVPLWWGLPDRNGWAFDEMEADDVVRGSERFFFGWSTRYPPMQYYLVAILYKVAQEVIDLLRLTPSAEEVHLLVMILARGLCALMATATVLLAYRCCRFFASRGPSLVAAAAVAFMPSMVYYAKTANLEAPYVFWFAWSLLFYLRAIRRQTIRDYLHLGAATALSIGSKDQAYALYLLAPIAIVGALWCHRRRTDPEVGLLAVLLDRRLLVGFAMSAGLFASIHRLPFDRVGIRDHVNAMIAISSPAAEYEPNLVGHLQMAAQSARHAAFGLSGPFYLAAFAGLLMAARRPRQHAALLSLLLMALGYQLFFVGLVRYTYVRFLLPVCILMAPFVAYFLERAAAWRAPPLAARATVALALTYSFLRGLSVDMILLADARYLAEDWIAANVPEGSKVVGLGRRKLMPRGVELVEWVEIRDQGALKLVEVDADYITVSSTDLWKTYEREFYRRLMLGEVNYRVVGRFERAPVLDILNQRRIRSNFDKLNPVVTVFERRGPWGPTLRELRQRWRALADRPYGEAHAELARRMLAPGVPQRRQLAGDDVVGYGMNREGLTNGRGPAFLAIRNRLDRPLAPTLSIGAGGNRKTFPIVARVDDGERSQTVELSDPGSRTIELAPIPARSVRAYAITTDRTWSTGRARDRQFGVQLEPFPHRLELAEDVEVIGVSTDGWTVDGKPAFLTVTNPTDRRFEPEIQLDCHARPDELPIEVLIAGDEARRVLIKRPGRTVVRLPSARAYGQSTYQMTTDRTWQASADSRRLGVRFRPAE